MASFFTWLDYSEREKRDMVKAIDQFREHDTLDELGMGHIRDAIADILFPGTSTIQTRARYFLFIPWLYLVLEAEAERSRLSLQEIGTRSRSVEVALIRSLLRGETDDTAGIIGRDAQEHLQRFPSIVYWNGLHRWGIRRFDGSREEYHRALERRCRARRNPDREARDAFDRAPGFWDRHLPQAPDALLSQASLSLTRQDADYLRQRISDSVPGSLLARLVSHTGRWKPADMPWRHPLCLDAPGSLGVLIEHARVFSEVIHGSALLYNLMLSELCERDDWTGRYRDLLAGWAARPSVASAALSRWDLDRFWRLAQGDGARITTSARRFVQGWVERIMAPGGASAVADDRAARDLIGRRESFLKRGQARLVNAHAREGFVGAAGVQEYNYRWPIVQRLLSDILDGLYGRPAKETQDA